jgi:hypothetical protein
MKDKSNNKKSPRERGFSLYIGIDNSIIYLKFVTYKIFMGFLFFL